ncbi:lipocalin family protein [Spirosoma areae]
MTRTLLLAISISLFATGFRTLSADDVSGTWKRVSMTLVDASGKATDMNQMMARTIPCTKDITYTFTSDGQMKTTVPDACGAMKKRIEANNINGRWVQTGRRVTVTTTLKDIPPATYDLAVQGNTMTWVFLYADNPKTPNPTKTQRITIVYQRV